MREAVSASRRRVGGFTLLELLATLTLVTLSFSLGAANLSVLSDRARLDELSSKIRDFHGRARLLARAEGSMWIEWDEAASTIRARRYEGGIEILSLSIDKRFLLRLDVTDDSRRAPITDPLRYLIDRDGRSNDVAWIVKDRDDPATTRRIEVSGSTGACDIEKREVAR